MLAALILLLVEAPHSAIVHDYVLTRIGAEPVRDILLGPLLGATGPASLDKTGVRNICGVPPGAMVDFIKTSMGDSGVLGGIS